MPLAVHRSLDRESQRPIRVLIVEDDGAAALLLDRIVSGMGHAPTRVTTGEAALEHAASGLFDLVLLDLGLPDIDGIEVAQRLRQRWAAEILPIVFVSGEHDPEARVIGFGVGGADFITKPYHIPEVRARVRHQLETLALRRELEHAAAVLESRVEDRTAQLSRRMTELSSEIEHRQRLEDELRRLAETDPLTGLLNQRGLPPRLDRWRAITRRGLLVATEVDGWESITGVLGHHDADQLLSVVAERVTSSDDDGPVGRLGASLFLSALAVSDGDVGARLQALRRHLEEPIALAGRSMRLTFSMGVVEDDGDLASTAELVRHATLALHAAKQNPGDTVVLDDARRAALADELLLEQELWGAAGRGELRLQYQPIFDVDTLRRDGFEALVRWDNPTRGPVSPGLFIPLAERSGAIVEIGPWTLQEATRQLARWFSDGVVDEDVTVAVNLSAVEAIDVDLPNRVRRALDMAGLRPSALEVELTETAVLRRGSVVRQILGELRGAGIGVCLDDFGTGSSSLTLLQQMPADVVKIDRSFVSEMVDDRRSGAIVESTIALAHRLGRRVVGEGVETLDQLEMLRDLGCDQVQGWLLSPPLDADRAAGLAEATIPASGRERALGPPGISAVPT